MAEKATNRVPTGPMPNDPSIWNPSADVIRNVDLELIFYGYEECKPGKNFGPGKKEVYKIHYVHRGKGIIKVGDRTLHVHGGNCFVFYPDDCIYYEADADDPWVYSWVAFDGANAEYYLKRANIKKEQILVEHCDTKAIEEAFSTLMGVDLKDPTKDLKYISMLYLILSAVQQDPDIGNVLRDMRYPAIYVKTAIKHIQENYNKDLSVADIADYLSIERKYFSRIFKEHIGVSPNTYITNFRMIKACELLNDPAMSIADIAADVGYDNPFSFSRAFKNCRGISPSEYREANNKE